jgi:glucokinase
MATIGMDIGGTYIKAGIVSKKGVEKLIVRPTYANSSRSKIISQISSIINELSNRKIEGIGIGVPSTVDVEKGIVFETVNVPSLRNVALKKILERKYSVPVFINNDANCFALGEKYFGKGRKFQDIVGMVIGTGIGAGIILNGKLYSGHNCGAGEFGEISFRDHNLEYYCSGKFFKEKYHLSGEDLLMLANKNDAKAIAIFEEFGINMSYALSFVVNSVDPEIIIFGGSVAKSRKFFERSMRKSLKSLIYKRSYSNLKIEFSDMKNITILGAASLCCNNIN